MHINLFLSLALNNTFWLVWYKFVLFDVRQAAEQVLPFHAKLSFQHKNIYFYFFR
jgi:hypothetical protein